MGGGGGGLCERVTPASAIAPLPAVNDESILI